MFWAGLLREVEVKPLDRSPFDKDINKDLKGPSTHTSELINELRQCNSSCRHGRQP
jgi:hypothetical protein